MTAVSWYPPLLTTAPHQREDFGALDRFNVQHPPTRQVFSGTGFELVTSQPRSDTLTTRLSRPPYFASHSNTRAIGDEPRSFEPWSPDKEDVVFSPPPSFYPTLTGVQQI
ncbi:hypothetical protein TNCV_4584131 [Trichonephila clavipes]|nr:hypothetical protein TNCV_4584131 [Trichonephila clavipes]